MVRRHNRLLVALYVVSDAVLAMLAFVLAYAFASRAAYPRLPRLSPLHSISICCRSWRFDAVCLMLQGSNRLRRCRSRVDDFFAVLIGRSCAVVFSLLSLVFGAYYAQKHPASGCVQVHRSSGALLGSR